MQTKFQENPEKQGLTVLAGASAENHEWKPLQPFDDRVLAYLSAVSKILMRDSRAKEYPDVITFGFFCRKGNLLQLKEQYEHRIAGRIGRGMAFHVAPSNVPINFGYTLISSLLAGNANVVKASSKDFVQTRIVCEAFQAVLSEREYSNLAPYVQVVMYDRNRQDLTEFFSSHCNIRVIWGGDQTIRTVRQAPIPPRTVELTFADRYSFVVIRAEAVVALETDAEKLSALAQDFYNDTYLYDQNACTSPRLIYWLGETEVVEKAKKLFWQAVYENIKDRYTVEAETAVNKLLAVDRTAIAVPGTKIVESPDNRIVRVEIPELPDNLPELRAPGGLFHEYADTTLDAIATIVDEKYQTLSYYGCDAEKLRSFVKSQGLLGIDKIVPLGHTADWMLTWDGYDLIETMSRVIVAT